MSQRARLPAREAEQHGRLSNNTHMSFGSSRRDGTPSLLRGSRGALIALRAYAGTRGFPAVVLSLCVLIPCFWQPHIQATDLPSHLYNAWLYNQLSTEN